MSNKHAVNVLITAINHGDEGAARAVLDDDLLSHGALGDIHGPDGFIKIMLHNVRTGFPDAQVGLASAMLLDMGLWPLISDEMGDSLA